MSVLAEGIEMLEPDEKLPNKFLPQTVQVWDSHGLTWVDMLKKAKNT